MLLCFDGSQDATEAIRSAGELLPGREALVLTVAIPAEAIFPLNPVGDVVGRLSGIYRDWDAIASEVAEQHARRGCQLATDAGLRAQPLTAVGKPAPTILRVADDHDVAVIVLGPARHAAFDGLLGSVSARVVHQARHPVLVIPQR